MKHPRSRVLLLCRKSLWKVFSLQEIVFERYGIVFRTDEKVFSTSRKVNPKYGNKIQHKPKLLQKKPLNSLSCLGIAQLSTANRIHKSHHIVSKGNRFALGLDKSLCGNQFGHFFGQIDVRHF